MEHKIGEVFDHEGQKIKAEITTNMSHPCEGCCLQDKPGCRTLKEFCYSEYREDGNEVILVKAE